MSEMVITKGLTKKRGIIKNQRVKSDRPGREHLISDATRHPNAPE
jgi:hypothetical protein